MARVIIVEEGENVVVGGQIELIGTTAAGEVITIVSGRIELNSSFNTGGDTINLPGSATAYEVRVLGTVVTIAGPEATLVIPAGPTGTAITFANGTDSRTLVFDAAKGAFVLGDIALGATGQRLPATDSGNQTTVVASFDGSDALDGGDGYDILVATLAAGTIVMDGAPISGFERIELRSDGSAGEIEFNLDDINAPSQGEILVFDGSAIGEEAQLFLLAYPDVSAFSVELVGGAGADYLDSDNARGEDVLRGGPGADELWAGSRAPDGRGDRAYGGDGDDLLVSIGERINALFGEAGNDSFFIFANTPTYADGGTGDDVFRFEGFLSFDDRIVGGEGVDRLELTLLADDRTLAGVEGVEILEIEQAVDISLGAGFEASGLQAISLFASTPNRLDAALISRSLALEGGSGDDVIIGTRQADFLSGRGGADRLEGGAGADRFVYAAASDSRGPAGRDTIVDFQSGLDRIDLSEAFAGQAFRFLGNFDSFAAATSGIGAGAGAGEMIIVYVRTTGGGVLVLDDDRDGAFTEEDFQIRLEGVVSVQASDIDGATSAAAPPATPDVMIAPYDAFQIDVLLFG